MSTTPVHRLPAELLLQIFGQLGHIEAGLRKAERANGRVIDPNILRFQVLVSQVCQQWRTVALSDGQLWSTFEFHYDNPPVRQRKLSPESKEWMKRSNGCLVDVYMKGVRRALQDHYKGLLTFISSVQAYSDYWRTLDIEIIPPIVPYWSVLWDGGTARLEKLLLRGAVVFNPAGGDPVSLLPQDAPCLRIVDTQGCKFQWSQWSFTHITELSMGSYKTIPLSPSFSDMVRVLTQVSPYLKMLTLRQWISDPETPSNPPIIFHCLKSLKITDYLHDAFLNLLTSFRYPALDSIDLQLDLGSSRQATDKIREALCKPELFHSVKQIYLDLSGVRSSDMEDVIVQTFPNVRHLHLPPFNPLSGPILTFLGMCWPELRILSISESGVLELRNAIEFRLATNGSRRLDIVNLVVSRGMVDRANYSWIMDHVNTFNIGFQRANTAQFLAMRNLIPFNAEAITETSGNLPLPQRREL